MQKLPNEEENKVQFQMDKIIQSLFTYSLDNGITNVVGTFPNFIGFKGKDEKSKIIFKKKIISNCSSSIMKSKKKKLLRK